MGKNIWPEIQKARAEISSAMVQLRALLEKLPPGADNLAVASALAHVVSANVSLNLVLFDFVVPDLTAEQLEGR